jgi:hypothetical protein
MNKKIVDVVVAIVESGNYRPIQALVWAGKKLRYFAEFRPRLWHP